MEYTRSFFWLMKSDKRGFTLLEVLVASGVLAIILLLVASVMGRTGSMWSSYRDRATAFETAAAAFERMTKTLAQATLNTYWQVQGTEYRRASELHFVTGRGNSLLPSEEAPYLGNVIFFQAPLGRSGNPDLQRLTGLLNAAGYFVTFNSAATVPDFLAEIVPPEPRYRLYEWMEGTEDNSIYSATGDGAMQWFRGDFASIPPSNSHVLADNVIGLVMMVEYPRTGGGTDASFEYNSQDALSPGTLHQLPPTIRLAMVVIDESSAQRLAEIYGASPPPITARSDWFVDPANFDEDLGQWEELLMGFQPRIQFRIFHATLGIRSAKWSL